MRSAGGPVGADGYAALVSYGYGEVSPQFGKRGMGELRVVRRLSLD